MVVRGQATITYADQLRASWNARMKRNFALAAAVVFMVGAYDLGSLPSTSLEAVLMTFALLATTAVFVLFAFVLLALSIFLRTARLSAAQRDVTYSFDDDTFVTADRNGAAITVPWSIVRRARETRKGFYVELKPAGTRYAPLRAFDPADLPALRALLREKLGKSAKLRG